MQAHSSHEEDCEIATNQKDSLDLLSYWQMFVWREPFHVLPIHKSALSKHSIVSQKILESTKDVTCPDGDYWVAPFWQDKENIWLPIWIPIAVLHKKIVLRNTVSLPWIPTNLFLPSSKVYLAPQALYDDFLKYECITEEGSYRFKTVADFLKASIELLVTLLNSPMGAALEAAELEYQEQWIMLSSVDLQSDTQIIADLKDENVLLKQFCQLDNDLSKEAISQENYLNIVHFHQASVPDTKTHTADYYYTLLGLLTLKKGMMQAVAVTKGVPFDALIKDYVANIFSLHALSKSSRPTIAMLSKANKIESITHMAAISEVPTIEAFLEECTRYFNISDISTLETAQELINAKITKTYEAILKTISISRNYYILREKNDREYGEVNAFLERLMNEDENIDEKRNLYIEIQGQWHEKLKSQTFVQKCLGWLSVVKQYRKKKASEYLQTALSNEPIDSPYEQQLVEKIRQLKVIQAKNDQRRIQAVDFLNQYQKAEQLWHKWMGELGLTDESLDTSIGTLNVALQALRATMWQLTVLYWQGQGLQRPKAESKAQTLDTNSPDKNLPDKNLIEYLLIPDAEQLSAISVLPLLRSAQRAIFFGDPLGQLNSGMISAQEDEFVLENIYQASDLLLEKMQVLGLNISHGSAFNIAGNNSKYRSEGPALERKSYLQLLEVCEKNKEIFDYWNEKYLQNQMILANKLQTVDKDFPVVFVDVSKPNRKSSDEHQRSNQEEADAIEALLHRHPEISERCVVITPFYKQYELLSRSLASFPVTVCHFSNMPSCISCEGYMSDYVIFSPVYQIQDSRPFVLDEGAMYFYKLLGLVKTKLWIVGDKRIFQKQMHSASGDFAKWIVQQRQLSKSDSQVPECV